MKNGLRVRIDKDVYQRARKRRGLTNLRVADRLNIDNTLLSHYTAGRREMPYDLAVRLADWIGIDVDELIEADSLHCLSCGRPMAMAAAV